MFSPKIISTSNRLQAFLFKGQKDNVQLQEGLKWVEVLLQKNCITQGVLWGRILATSHQTITRHLWRKTERKVPAQMSGAQRLSIQCWVVWNDSELLRAWDHWDPFQFSSIGGKHIVEANHPAKLIKCGPNRETVRIPLGHSVDNCSCHETWR